MTMTMTATKTTPEIHRRALRWAAAQAWAIEHAHARFVAHNAADAEEHAARTQNQRPPRLGPHDLEPIALPGDDPQQHAYGLLRHSPADVVAVVPVHGVMVKRQLDAERFAHIEDLTSAERFERAVHHAATNPDVTTVVLDIDSPGGNVHGTADFVQAVERARQHARVVAFANDLCASGAYFLACAADAVAATPMASVGSIGVMVMLCDDSAMYQSEGARMIAVASGPHKATGGPGLVIGDEQLAPIQRSVDTTAATFFGYVADRRGLDSQRLAAVTGGELFAAADAAELGLLDELLTPAHLLEELVQLDQPARSTRQQTG